MPYLLRAVPNEELLQSAYSAYSDILRAVIEEHGIGNIISSAWNANAGIVHAELIDFDNDGIPELLYVYVNKEEQYTRIFVVIYGYQNGKAELLDEYELWFTHVGYDIAIDQHGISYFYYHSLYSFDSVRYYYTMVDGEWTRVLMQNWEVNAMIDDTDKWFVNGLEVDRQAYNKALEDLSIVRSRVMWWGGRGPFSPDTVFPLLTRLDERIG
jgi:hypothetical protein